jgi:hypothetical protein
MLGLRRRVVLAGGRRVRWRFGAGLALLAAVAVVAGVLVSTASSGSPASSGPAGGTSSGAAAVERRDLVQTDTESGTLSYADPQTVYDRLSGTITWLPGVGQVIKPGQPLFKVDGKPVTLMDGTTPAYRDLSPSDSAGQDILELNRNLVRLGFNPEGIVVDDTWQAATTAGVDVLQAYLGEAETGSLSLGQVVFLPGDQLVSTVDATLGGTGASSSPGSSANASDPVGAARPEFVSLPTRPSPGHHGNPGSEHKPGGQPNLKTLEALIALLRAEIAELQAQSHQPHTPSSPSSPHGAGPSSSNGGHPSSSGAGNPSSSSAGNPGSSSAGNPGSSGSGSPSSTGGGGSASAILHTTSTRLIVTVELDASKQSEAKVGEPVTVELPGGNAVNGKITAVSPVAQSSSGNGNGNGGNGNGGNGNGNGSNNSSGSVIPVTIALSGQHLGAGLDQASVSVSFAQAKASNVLSVPVTALLATAGGGYAVQAAAAPHALIRVTTGLFAAGYVQISGPGIYQGLEVTDSQG